MEIVCLMNKQDKLHMSEDFIAKTNVCLFASAAHRW